MAKATWRIVALSALLGAVAPLALTIPAQAQVVIGGSNQPDVVVNWSVLDGLGRQPSLADMLKQDMPGRDHSPVAAPAAKRTQAGAAPQGLAYKPYKPGKAKVAAVEKPAKAKPVAKPVKTAAAPKPQPVRDEPADIAAMVQARQTAAPQIEVPKVEAPKPAAIAKAPEPAKVTPPKPAEIAKVPEPVKVETPKAPEPAKVETPKPVEIAKAPEPVKPTPAPVPVAPVAVAPAPVVAAPQPMQAVVPPPIPVMPQQVASLPSSEPPAVSGGSDTLSLGFAADDSKLSDSARADLATLVKRMQKDEDLNLQLLAYASGDEASASKARRLSLSRALEVRKVLMDKGIRSTRIEVRALGNKLDGRGSADRVDAVLVGR